MSNNDNVNVQDPKETKAFQRLKKKLTIDVLWMWILKLLSEGPKYAYELKQEMQRRFGFSSATVTNYTVLYLLEKEGIVKKVEISNDLERIDRKYYTLTPLGIQLFEEAKKFLKEIYNVLFKEEIV
ncbi:MAG: PadR family transcriptional regulator [Candidatus Heimdallarchaeaceae archaeon]